MLDRHIVGMISHLAAMLPVADGLGLAAQLRQQTRVAAAFVGDGGTSEGDFHEAVNLAAVWKLPVIFVVENNQLPPELFDQWRTHDPIARFEHALDEAGAMPASARDEFRQRIVRIRNTPIIESGAIGAGLGLALDGFHPIVEMQYGDFVSCGFNQIVNNLAKTHYRWGAPAPIVVRLPIGGGLHAGPFHSQNVESWFTSVAGLKVVAPATPFDAKGLLIAACEDGNPVLFLEHKWLYRALKGRVPEGYYGVPIGKATLARKGTDATIVAYGVAVHWATDAADALAAEGKSIEVVDLRSLIPWDAAMVLDSVKRTGRCLVVHEALVTGGFGGEVAAVVARDAFAWLDAPVERLGALDTPVPAAQALEDVFSPKARLLPALRALLAY